MIRDIIGQFKNAPRILILAGLLILAFLYIAEYGKEAKGKIKAFFRQRWKVLFLFYLAFILTGTIFGRQITNPVRKVFTGFIFLSDTKWDKEILENVLLFVPYSFLYLQAFHPAHPWKSSILLTAATTAVIEISQLLFWLGFFQIADIIHNIIGGLIGCILWIAMKAIWGKVSAGGNTERNKLE